MSKAKNWKTLRGAETYARHFSEARKVTIIVNKKLKSPDHDLRMHSSFSYHTEQWLSYVPIPDDITSAFCNGVKVYSPIK